MKVKELIELLGTQDLNKTIEFYHEENQCFLTLNTVEQEVTDKGKIAAVFLNLIG